jgi:hypothetical protein
MANDPKNPNQKQQQGGQKPDQRQDNPADRRIQGDDRGDKQQPGAEKPGQQGGEIREPTIP